MTPSRRAFIRALPKTETHIHIEGALPYELLRGEWPDRFPEDTPFRRRGHRYESFPAFEKILLGHALPWFTSAERYHEAAKAIFLRQASENVRYVEASFHLPITQFIKVPGPEIIAAIRAAAPPGMEVRVFAGMLRNDYGGPLRPVIDELHSWTGLAGVDLHGFEATPTEPWTAAVWARARASGKITKCHAGEFDGARRVREAIEELGVLRVQHGVRAIEDPAVVRLAGERGATFDMCPLSNVALRVVGSIREHPIRRLMEAGIRCTVSTDDPLCFANTVVGEYEALADGLGFGASELARIAQNGWEVADVPRETRDAVLGEIAGLLAAEAGRP